MGVKREKPDEDEPVFSVDTHLFRELGNHLVGRDSTALIELVKNAYDADATEVIVMGLDLADRKRASIVITDNGTGMTEKQFRRGFLRIAARGKEEGDRRSPVFKRRYTGAKGIGRLAAHKLAEMLSVYSVSGTPGSNSKTGVEATIDWAAIEECDSLDQISDEVSIAPLSLIKKAAVGTRIELSRLRRPWTPGERTLFVQECRSLQAPAVLVEPIVPSVIDKVLLFDQPTQRLTSEDDKGFTLRLEGDFDTGEPLWNDIAKTSEWVVEIDASRALAAKAQIRYGIAPTKYKSTRESDTETTIKPEIFSHPRQVGEDGPYFQARILVQVDPKGNRDQRSALRKESGIRVYVEGFRVLPYGDEGNDWLTLDSDYTRRSALQYTREVEAIFGEVEQDKKWSSMTLPNRSYFGAVFITQDDAGELTPLINREGFLPNAGYFRLREWVRIGIDLFTRVRSSVEYQERVSKKAKQKKQKQVRGSVVLSALKDATEATKAVRLAASSGDPDEISEGVAQLSTHIAGLKDTLEEFVAETDILRVTASVGTQMAEFVHEVQSLLGTTEAVSEAIDRLRTDKTIPATKRSELAAIHINVSDMRKQLERQASYLLDIATPDASRRRGRQHLADRFDRAVKLVERSAEKRGITIRNTIPPEFKSPKMFPAELTTIFSNLLTNAVKNAGDNGIIQASAQETKQGIVLKVQNTGSKVDLENSERLFLPYVSTTTSVDTTLGQGMGLGLTITRKTLEEYGATICFVVPGKQYQTAVQIVFPAED